MSLLDNFRIPSLMKPVVIHPIYSEPAVGIYLASIRKESLRARIERNKKRIAKDEDELKFLEALGKRWATDQKEKQNELYKFGEQ